MNQSKFFKSLINATDMKQVQQILDINKNNFNTRFVDDDDNNEGGIEVIGDAIGGFAERTTNMFNANLLYESKIQNKELELKGKTPREAVELLYQVPQGRLSNIKKCII